MVNSPSGPVNDLEQKRRKQTLERAKANHLSRQLQMRLQYAKLKVDHGWQKQNLNEVENLYFHHSHMRGPRPYPAPMVATFAHPTQTAYPANSHSAQSNLSFRQHLGGVRAGITANIEHGDANDSESYTQNSAPQSGNPSSPAIDHELLSSDGELLAGMVDPSQGQDPLATTISIPTSPRNRSTPPLTRTDFQSLARIPPVTSPTRSSKSRPRLKARAKPGHSMSPASSLSNSPHKQNATLDADALSNLQGMSGGRGSPFQGGGIVAMGHNINDGSSVKGNGNNGGYGFASSMTYDSFWSSHSSTMGQTLRDVMRGN